MIIIKNLEILAPENKVEKLSDYQNIKEIKNIMENKYKKIYEEFFNRTYGDIT